MCMQVIMALWNGGLMDLSKSYKIDCIRKINSLVRDFVISRCDEDSRFHIHQLFELFEQLVVTIIEKNPEGRRHLQFVVDRDILCIVQQINTIQSREEKHCKYLEQRKFRKPTHTIREKHKKKKNSCNDSDSSCDED